MGVPSISPPVSQHYHNQGCGGKHQRQSGSQRLKWQPERMRQERLGLAWASLAVSLSTGQDGTSREGANGGER